MILFSVLTIIFIAVILFLIIGFFVVAFDGTGDDPIGILLFTFIISGMFIFILKSSIPVGCGGIIDSLKLLFNLV